MDCAARRTETSGSSWYHGPGHLQGNLGNAFKSHGDYAKAIEYHTHCLAIAKEVGDRAGEGGA